MKVEKLANVRPVAGTGRAAARAGSRRLLVFVPARRDWPGGARGTLGPTNVVRFLAVGVDGSTEQGEAQLARLPQSRSVEIVFDALDVYTATIDAPRLSEARLRQALPNLVEESMLGDPADYHFAWTPLRRGDGAAPEGAPDATRLSVSAVDRATLARTLEALRLAQLEPRAAYSEIYTLPHPAGGMVAARVHAGRAVLRTGTDQALPIDIDESAAVALRLAARQLGFSRLRVYGDDADALAATCTALGLQVERAGRALDAEAAGDPVNLLQGAYAPAGSFGLAGRLATRLTRDGAWKAPAAWLGACALISIAGVNALWVKLGAQYDDVRQSMQHEFRDAFPGETTVVDELAQARRALGVLRARAGRPSSDDFSVLNAQALQVFANAPVGIVSAIDYADGAYVLRFTPGSVDSAALRNTLQGRALAQGLTLRFEADGSARLAPGGR